MAGGLRAGGLQSGGLRALRPRADWLPRASVGLGIAATIAMNVAAGSRGGVGGALLGVLFPVGLVLSLETLIWLVRRLQVLQPRGRGWAWCVAASLPLAGLAGITGVISYLHALTVAQWTAAPGEPGMWLTEHLIPLVADLMIATGSVALVALARNRGRPAPARSQKQDNGQPAHQQPDRQPDRKPENKKPGPRKRNGPAPRPVPNVAPATVARLAAVMPKRALAEELSRLSGETVTVWKAETLKRQHAAGLLEPAGSPNGSANGGSANGGSGSHPDSGAG